MITGNGVDWKILSFDTDRHRHRDRDGDESRVTTHERKGKGNEEERQGERNSCRDSTCHMTHKQRENAWQRDEYF